MVLCWHVYRHRTRKLALYQRLSGEPPDTRPLINTPLQRGETAQPIANTTASAVSSCPRDTVAAGVSPGDANPSVPKKHKPYWLNGHYYENPEYPEHIARAICARAAG